MADPLHSPLSCRIESSMSKSAANSRSPIMVTESPKVVTSGAGDPMLGSKVSIIVDVLWEANEYCITAKKTVSHLKDNIYTTQLVDSFTAVITNWKCTSCGTGGARWVCMVAINCKHRHFHSECFVSRPQVWCTTPQTANHRHSRAPEEKQKIFDQNFLSKSCFYLRVLNLATLLVCHICTDHFSSSAPFWQGTKIISDLIQPLRKKKACF